MPKYRINCSTTTSYTLVVEAPDKAAAEKYYDGCDAGEFTRLDGNADWEIDYLYLDPAAEDVDVTVDKQGKKQ